MNKDITEKIVKILDNLTQEIIYLKITTAILTGLVIGLCLRGCL